MYKVFISHSTNDMDLVYELRISLGRVGVEPYVAEYYPEPDEELPQKIKRNIDDSQSVVALLTHDGIRSQWVNQEIGYADKAGKKIIPIVEEGVEISGFLTSKERILFNRANPYEVSDIIISRLQHLKIEKEKVDFLVQAGIAVFFSFGSYQESKHKCKGQTSSGCG